MRTGQSSPRRCCARQRKASIRGRCGGNNNLGEAPKSRTREEQGKATNSIARRGQGAIAPCGVQRQSLWWGLGQRPNCFSSDQFKRNSQQRRRQRSVPASNFARPQTRPQAALPTTCALPRHMGATDPIFHAAPNNLRGVLAFAAGVVYNHSRAMNGSDAGIAPGKRVRGGGRRMGSGRVIPTGSCGQSPPVRLRERTQERGQGGTSAFALSRVVPRSNAIRNAFVPAKSAEAEAFSHTISRFACAICLRLFPAVVRSFHLA